MSLPPVFANWQLSECLYNRLHRQSYSRKNRWYVIHAQWIRLYQEDKSPLVTTIYHLFGRAMATTTIVGIPHVMKAMSLADATEWEQKFHEKNAERSPPPNYWQSVKTARWTYNHINIYMIHQDLIWYKPIQHPKSDWKLLYFDGYPEERIPVQIQADGSNLIVIDDMGEVHYKKVLREVRDPQTNLYRYQDKTDKNNWKPEWYTFPLLRYVGNALVGGRLKIPTHARAWAISHRGKWNHYSEDITGKPIHDLVGVTTLYILLDNGKDIRLYDPWMFHPICTLTLPLPESPQSSFTAINLSASASTVFVIGYKARPKHHGMQKELRLYTRHDDIDTLGWNPLKSYSYHKSAVDDDDTRIIPGKGWVAHPLPKLSGKATLTRVITITQTGRGKGARQLMIRGLDAEGKSGIYYKVLRDQKWTFHQEPAEILPEEYLPLKFMQVDEPFRTTVGNYHVEDAKLRGHLVNFGERSLLSTLYLELGEESVYLYMYKRKGLLHHFGKREPDYHLILPKGPVPKIFRTMFAQIFGEEKFVPVHVHKSGKGVTLSFDNTPMTIRMKAGR